MQVPRVRLRLWHSMAVVAFAGAVFATYVWLDSLDEITPAILVTGNRRVVVAGYELNGTSPAFSVVQLLVATVMIGLPVGVFAWAARVLGRGLNRDV
jgi:hypothetical protein